MNKRQASLILRVDDSYFIQIRDNVKNAKFRFPGVLSLFGGEVEDNENGYEGFRREMSEEIFGLDFSKIDLKVRVYHWRSELTDVERRINEGLENNFDLFRGFDYNDIIPLNARGSDKKPFRYIDLFHKLEEDLYFVGEIKKSDLEKIKIQEGKGILVPETLIPLCLFYPTDKIAICDDIIQRRI